MIWLFLGAVALFCIGYTVGHAAGSAARQDLREAIAEEIVRTVMEIDEKERKQTENAKIAGIS